MYRLMKAEWYRLTHSNHFLGWIAFFCGVLVLLQITMGDNVFALTMEEIMPLFGESWFFGTEMFVPTLVGAIVACGYARKTAYYEVMAGDTIFPILVSKVFVVGVFVATCTFGASCIVPAIVCTKNGIGNVTDFPIRILLMWVVVLHVCIAAVLIVTTLRHITATVIVYLRFAAVDILIPFIYNLLCVNPDSKFSDWFVAMQISRVLYGELDSYLIVVIFASMLIEGVFWYTLSYIGMKKKVYN